MGAGPVPLNDDQLFEFRFKNLALVWREETAFLSSTTQIASHSAYREIVSMGKEVVPLILAELQKSPAIQWFIALREITGQNPVPQKHAGRLDLMTKDWLAWGKEKGLI